MSRQFCNDDARAFDERFKSLYSVGCSVGLVICIFGVTFNAYLIFMIYRLLKRKRVPVKRYLLILNLCLIDGTISLAAVVFTSLSLSKYVFLKSNGRSFTNQILKSTTPVAKHALMTAAVAGPSVGYVCLCVYELIAVRWPLYYLTRLTKRKTIQTMIVVWVVSILITGMLAGLHINAFTMKFKHLKKMESMRMNQTQMMDQFNATLKDDENCEINDQDSDLIFINENILGKDVALSGRDKNKSSIIASRKESMLLEDAEHLRTSAEYVSDLFFAYHLSELAFNVICLVTVVLCYVVTMRVVRERHSKMHFVKGHNVHFVIFVITTIDCAISNCIAAYLTPKLDKMGHYEELLEFDSATNPDMVGADDMSRDQATMIICQELAIANQFRGLLFTFMIGSLLVLARLMLNSFAYIIGNKNFLSGKVLILLRKRLKSGQPNSDKLLTSSGSGARTKSASKSIISADLDTKIGKKNSIEMILRPKTSNYTNNERSSDIL